MEIDKLVITITFGEDVLISNNCELPRNSYSHRRVRQGDSSKYLIRNRSAPERSLRQTRVSKGQKGKTRKLLNTHGKHHKNH